MAYKKSEGRSGGLKISGLKKAIILIVAFFSQILAAQEKDSTSAKVSYFGGAVTIQSKGISTIPNLTLGKPAAIFDMKVGRKLTFEPQFRFSLEGKPWAIVFWWRYSAPVSSKFSLVAHANTSLSFKDINIYTDTASGSSQEIIRTTRYLAAALAPNYQFNKYIGLGMYLFYTRGIEVFITKNTYMLALRPSISNIPIYRDISARIGPEIYYLKMDSRHGYYLNATLSVTRKNFPLSLTALYNKALESDIPSTYTSLWNVGISYSFSNKYVEAR